MDELSLTNSIIDSKNFPRKIYHLSFFPVWHSFYLTLGRKIPPRGDAASRKLFYNFGGNQLYHYFHDLKNAVFLTYG